LRCVFYFRTANENHVPNRIGVICLYLDQSAPIQFQAKYFSCVTFTHSFFPPEIWHYTQQPFLSVVCDGVARRKSRETRLAALWHRMRGRRHPQCIRSRARLQGTPVDRIFFPLVRSCGCWSCWSCWSGLNQSVGRSFFLSFSFLGGGVNVVIW